MEVSTPMNMTQNVDLARYNYLIQLQRAKVTIRRFNSLTTIVHLIQLDANQKILERESINAVQWHGLLHPKTSSILITISSSASSIGKEMWLEYVELYLESDVKAPDTQLLRPWNSEEL
jgi:hypothetical protein